MLSTVQPKNEVYKGKESGLVGQILGYFKWSSKYHLFRCNSGIARAFFGNGFVHLAPKGTPDIIGFDKETGYFIGIETKIKTNKLNPDQAGFAKKLRGSKKGIYILARSLDDVLDILEPRAMLPF